MSHQQQRQFTDSERATLMIYLSILNEGGRFKIEGETLICGPAGVALSWASEISTHKQQLIELIRLRIEKPSKQLQLEFIKEGICPYCETKLDLQKRRPDAWWACGFCRIQIIESDYEPAITS